MDQEPVRLSKLMAQRGMCSRREADEFIARGLVFVDGVRTDVLGTKVLAHQTISLAAEASQAQDELATIVLNKPVGFVSGQPEKGYEPAVVLIKAENQAVEFGTKPLEPRHLKGLAPAGRLDIDSRGLLIFTQDGRIARQLTSDDSKLEKEYIVRVRGEISPAGLDLLRHGLVLDRRPLKPATVDRLEYDRLRFVLREGRHRQIRRMCQGVQLEVLSLKRVRIGSVVLGALKDGQWRFLARTESF